MTAETGEFGGEERRQFMRYLLRDLRALEQLIIDGGIEEGIRRTGTEQEVFLIDSGWHPAPAALKILDKIDDSHFTTELGLFNLEFNLDPIVLSGNCFTRMQKEMTTVLERLRKVAAEVGVGVILTGILPTLRLSDLGLDNMTPNPRYIAINKAIGQLRGSAYEFYIKGLDELMVQHDSIMLESCNASFQVHVQVGATEFANMYNVAQALSGPVLAVSCNSPMLFGRRLWAETRIALFQQAIDTRTQSHLRESSPRVTFGSGWVRKSITEIYKEDVARFRALVGAPIEEDPFQKLRDGLAPDLTALRLQNGTVYRWNRPCYGVLDGKAHLRIENRVMPSGPSILDEVANAAFWLGLMEELSARYDDVTKVIEFEHAKANFLAAGRQGLGAHFAWLDGKEAPAANLILDDLLPAASEGLARRGISSKDSDKYLSVIEKRVASGRTGSRWMLQSFAEMKGRGTLGQRLNALTAATVTRQKGAKAVSEWELAESEETGAGGHNYFKVEQYMQTDVTSVQADESVDLVANLMEWERIRHVAVEDRDHRLIGIVSYRAVLRVMAQGKIDPDNPVAVADIMVPDPIVVNPETPTIRAIEIMREYRIGSLPVVSGGRLVGMVTERDFMDIAAELLEEKLRT